MNKCNECREDLWRRHKGKETKVARQCRCERKNGRKILMNVTSNWEREFEEKGTRQALISRLKFHRSLFLWEVAERTRIAHQTISKHMRRLVEEKIAVVDNQDGLERWTFNYDAVNLCPKCGMGEEGQDAYCDDCYKEHLGTHAGARGHGKND